MRAPSYPTKVLGLLLASIFAVTGTFEELTASSTVVLTNEDQITTPPETVTFVCFMRALPLWSLPHG
jgi:hypothetical protein